MTTIPPLTVVSAGAGSGKTYKLQTLLGSWVANNVVAPERIVAVTFTEAAAIELQGRIRAELIGAQRLEDALKLDEAFITTIHGFGLRLLSEYAFEAGSSPRPRLLNDDEEAWFIRRALAEAGSADPIVSDLGRFGYRYDFASGTSPEGAFRRRVLDVIGVLRLIDKSEDEPGFARYASDFIEKTYGPVANASTLDSDLSTAVDALLADFPDNLADTAPNNTARGEFESGYRALQDALEPGRISNDFALWTRLTKLRMSKRGAPTPDGYDPLASDVIGSASQLYQHPGPRDRETTHIRTLFQTAFESLELYRASKQSAGLVDYVDMLSGAYQLLGRGSVIEDLKSRIDCLVIDEFQDTNPIQFALLWALQKADIPTVIVGDTKQAIMGFQGADPRLMKALTESSASSLENLTENWRTQPSLMPFVNAISKRLFGAAYVELAPRAADGFQSPLEVIEYPNKPRYGRRTNEVRATRTAERLAEILGDNAQFVRDRHTGLKRQLRGGDIAILCPTNGMLKQYAGILNATGLRCRLAENGWLESPIIQLIWHALEYVANPDDKHAALYLSVTDLGTHTLEEALKALANQQSLPEPVLKRLSSLAEQNPDTSIDIITQNIIDTLDLYGAIAGWDNSSQIRADLLRFEGEAQQFVIANAEALASAGIHGSGIKSFLAWITHRSDKKEFDARPPGRVVDNDAIELVTWHRSKGREWPVVAVCGWETTIRTTLPNLSVVYDDFNNMDHLLSGAHISYSPKFESEEVVEKFREPLVEESREEARRLIYVALTRAREKIVMEWPSHRDGKDTDTYCNELRDMAGVSLCDGGLQVDGVEFSALHLVAPNEFPEDFDPDSPGVLNPTPRFGRRALHMVTDVLDAGEAIPDGRSPSMHGDYVPGTPVIETSTEESTYGTEIEISTDMEATDLGTYLHTCFEIGNAVPRDKLRQLIDEQIDDEILDDTLRNVSAFNDWLSSTFPGAELSHELPILFLDDSGSVVSGFIDLVVETDDGIWIIDHKSDRVTDPKAKFTSYVSQLEDYADGLSKARTDKDVVGIAINWIRLGTVSTQRVHS
jgi:ATP-dependent helicase/nuclease subunit A